MVVLVHGDAELMSWPLLHRGPLELSVVDELAQLQLAARRLGFSVRLRGACVELCELLDLVGLRDVLPPARLPREVGGQVEGSEQAGIEEVVVPDDPIA